ncbi:uncharacterized protein LOC123202299 [Mangifera indica]|uniref:uncharacterized protein LOC123202299 n=1 Tax=Mangifera indica TaxID=29780 RepID=UPI001CF9D7D2|nr:uncharacterized protein LOC123202299 [Mangifera indica]XP_044474089.1 uncharacterized protein LOC123202299 [Mangifera indica]XP_044474090.1 uncharacterized protein LOC123202299 [Mangifera indica]
MEEFPLQKVAISGPTLASMIQRFSSFPGDVDGFIFGHVTQITTLSDDTSSSDNSASQITATITSFLCSGSTLSFYDAIGRINIPKVPSHNQNHHLLGWFSGRRQSALRPSMREFSVTNSLTKIPQFKFSIKNSSETLTPCVFVLFTTPLTDQLIHTHQHSAYQFNTSKKSFQPKSLDVVNIGPAFRGHYDNFVPNCALPLMNCSAMDEDSMTAKKERASDKKQLDLCAEGFQIERLRRLMGPEAANFTESLEELYEKMLAKAESLARLVESSSAKVLELENHNRKLRYKISRSAGLE